MSDNQIDPNEHPVRANRGIVIVVATLGVLIVLGLGGLVYGIALKAGKLGNSDDAPPEGIEQTETVSQTVSGAGRIVQSMTAADGIVYLHVVLPDGGEQVRAYDRTGAFLFSIDPSSE